MSNALAIAGTSAVLQNLLNGVLSGAGLGNVTVTAVAPDIVQSLQGSSPTLRVNLFLHQVTPNAAWRNVDLPFLAADGKSRLRNQPLALDLHYLLTAYGTHNFEAEALLGHAVLALHQAPVLARGDIQNALNALNPAPANDNSGLDDVLNFTGLADQVEMLKVTPATLGREEIAWLWTALKADYRPTFPFQVTVVLIQAQDPTNAPLPVGTRVITAQAGLLSSIVSATPPFGQSAACLGDSVTVSGKGLGNAVGIVLSNAYLGIQYPGPLDPAVVPSFITNTSLQFVVPNQPTRLPSGVYSISVQVQPPGLSTPVTSNSVPLALAPKITSALPGSVTGPSFNLNPTCSPVLLARQKVSMILGSQEFLADPLVPPQITTNSPTFAFTNVAPGTYLVRLRVDGIDSPVTYSPLPGFPTIKVT
jgi:hypothetical protein